LPARFCARHNFDVKPLRIASLVASLTVVAVACGGSSGSSIDDTNGTQGSDAGGSGSGSDGSVNGPGTDGGNGGGNGKDAGNGGGNTNDAGGTGGGKEGGGGGDSGGACPDEAGRYTMTIAGAGCGNLSTNNDECVTQSACTINAFALGMGGNGLEASNITIDMLGAFSMAPVKEGNAARGGCVGTWDDAKSTLTIDCGGTGSTQSCIVTLTRSSTSCK
jgi:hypothetical protein